MIKINPPSTAQKSSFIPFTGGLDIESPPISIPPGFVRSSQNFEEDINGGYVSLTGYERFSGKPAPHLATYALLNIGAPGTIAVGDVIEGATSGATAVVIAITSTQFVITKRVGDFGVENLTTGSASVVGPSVTGATSGDLPAQYRNLAADNYRADISAVPGAGNILGIWYYKGVVYAFRNDAVSGVNMYKSSASGWTLVSLGIEVTYTGGSGTPPAEGATITQGAVTATLKRLTITSGTFAGANAAGSMIFAAVTSGPFTAAALTGGMTGTVVAQSAITLANQGGRFKFVNANFTGSADTLRMYGVDGKNAGFEFDGTTFVPIHNLGMGASDKPSNVVAHRNYLFYSYHGSVQYSALGNPYNWEVIGGADEIGASDEVTGFVVQPGGGNLTATLAVYCRNRTYFLYGNDPTTWQLLNFSETTGAIGNSMQIIGNTYVMDDRGIQSLAAVQEFGNFAESSISRKISSLLYTKRNILTDTHIARDKQQYRVFFSDGSAIYATIGRKVVSMMPVLLPNPVLCSVSSETYGGGEELIYFGSSNGMVYQMEQGTSFDGAAIDANLYMVFDNLKDYRTLNRYRRMSFEMIGSGYAKFQAGYDLGYASSQYAQPDLLDETADSSPPKWGDFKGGEFIWDGSPLTSLSFGINGNGENIALKILSNSDYYTPVKFSGIYLEYTPLRKLR